MRPRELVPILAERFGIPGDTAFTIDRSLSEHGLRAKGKGRNWPDMTRREAIHFLIGCMICLNMRAAAATRAYEDVAIWVSATAHIIIGNDEDDSEVEELVKEGRPESEVREEIRKDYFRHFPFLKELEGKDISLVDYLLLAMHIKQGEDPWCDDGGDIVFLISPSHYEATVTIKSTIYGAKYTETFYPDQIPESVVDRPPQIRSVISVNASALAEIWERTADPLSEGGDI